ncbi:YbjQ family protein [Olivibacter sp. CPCC 100613]|uniref:YbjQ family protein n=1 Tax=Olivibacter sp. CPCC 100613 TaxID=3079931 RepID=UPI002FF74FDF
MNRIITTTTDTLDGYTIEEYYEPITANVVVGSNVFSDIAAGWTDFFGGRSSTYERKLQDIYKQAIETLSERAKRVGANCIVGLRIDVDEISGKGTQMFMITALGTPVRATKQGEKQSLNTGKSVDGNLVKDKIDAKIIIDIHMDNPKLSGISDAKINFILEKRFPEFAPLVLSIIQQNYKLVDFETKERLEKLCKYFGGIDSALASAILFNELQSSEVSKGYRITLNEIIITYDLIDYEAVLQILRNENDEIAKTALAFVKANKLNYTVEDKMLLAAIKQAAADRFKPIVEFTTKKKMFSSSENEVWKCTCGNLNELSRNRCSSCTKDHYGFRENETSVEAATKIIDNRIEVIEELM